VLALCSKIFSALLAVPLISPVFAVTVRYLGDSERLQSALFSLIQLHPSFSVVGSKASLKDLVPKLTA